MQTSPLESSVNLAGFGVVAGMSEEQQAVLVSCGQIETYTDGQPLVNWDDTAFDLLLLLNGSCEIRTQMEDVLHRLGTGSLIGELSFLDQKPRSAKAVAVGECHVIRFPASLLNDLEQTRPDIVAKFLKNIGLVLCQKLRSTTRFAEASFV